MLRTEPWPAPMLSGSAATAGSASVPSARGVRYVIDRSVVRIELPARRAKPQASVSSVEGNIDLDLVHAENTRAEIKADLLSLSISKNDHADEPALLARAFDWLELSAAHSEDERSSNRYAVVRISAFDPVSPTEPGSSRKAQRVTAYGDLTLHHFRVPVILELDVEFSRSESGPEALTIRTRRPLVVSLAAHDILPRDPQGTVLTSELGQLGTEVGREAHISCELHAVPAPANAAPKP